MANVKLVVIYPRPKDIEAFEKVYQKEHVPLAIAKLGGKTKIVATKVLASPQGTPPFTALRRFISRRCRIWKRVRRQMAGSRSWPTRFRFLPGDRQFSW
jgi:hypothetical protein